MTLATRVKEESKRAGVAHEELQEMADDRQRWKEGKNSSKEEQKSDASTREILKKYGQRCDGDFLSMPSSRIIQLVIINTLHGC